MVDKDAMPDEGGQEGWEGAKALEELTATPSESTPEMRANKTEQEPGAERAVEIIDEIIKEVGPEAAAHMVESNVVLTLAGLRGHTEYFIPEPTPEQRAEVAQINEVLLTHGIQVRGTDSESASTGKPSYMVEMRSLDGYARVSAASKIPGVEPFDADTGWEGLKEWDKKTYAALQEAQSKGLITPGIDILDVLVGVAKGYPDRAILGGLEVTQVTHKQDELTHTQIAHTGTYHEAQPNYSHLEADSDDPSIVENKRLWGATLGEFYASELHQSLVKNEAFQVARAEGDKE